MSAPTDVHQAAMAAAGAATVHDPRAGHDQRGLIGGIVRALRAQSMRCTVEEATAAVDRFYANNDAGETLTGEGFVHALRRNRIQVVREHDAHTGRQMTAREQAEWCEDKDAIRAWDCPTCGVTSGVRCLNLKTGKTSGEWFPGHPARIVLATGLARHEWSTG